MKIAFAIIIIIIIIIAVKKVMNFFEAKQIREHFIQDLKRILGELK